jgi:hypothetical protein
MEDNGEVFPEASYHHIMNKIKSNASKFDSLQEYAIYLLKQLDVNDDKFVDYHEFGNGLRAMGINITNQE